MQDDVFGTAKLNKKKNRWVYIAEIKSETPKSIYLGGTGKSTYKYDMGETYDDIKKVGIFIWDKDVKKIFKVEIDANLVPACPKFSNEEGSKIIFHAYNRK